MTSPEGRAYYLELHKTPAFGADGFDLVGLRDGMATRREPSGDDIRCTAVQINGVPAEWVMARDADPDVRLLYLHGGGYVSGNGAYYLCMAAHISQAAHCAVLLPDYRLAPEDPFPAGLDDALCVYEWVLANGPAGLSQARGVFVAGDSAGGGLTLATLLAARDRGLPLPKGAITLSAWTDLTLSGESIWTEEANDPIMSPRCLPDFAERYLGRADPKAPLASPIFGDYHGVPPLLIQVGQYEIIRDDSVRVAAKAQADGVQVQLEVYPGMFHVFPSHEPLLPEAREAMAHMAAFMQACLA
ncbi:MAG: alpha/beta hydrolase [Anaerolineae bacterium]